MPNDARAGGSIPVPDLCLAFDPSEEAPIHGLLGHSIIYRIATGQREGRKVFTWYC